MPVENCHSISLISVIKYIETYLHNARIYSAAERLPRLDENPFACALGFVRLGKRLGGGRGTEDHRSDLIRAPKNLY